MYPVSARFLEHINGTHHALVQARLLTTTQFGANPTGTDLPILSGDVKLSATSDNKSTLEIVVPGDYRDLVMPFGTEVWVARGIDYGDTTQEMVPLGYFRIDDVEQESAPYGPVRLSCSDRISQLKQNRVLYPFQVPEGYTHRKLFERLVNGRLSVGSADTPAQTQAAMLIRDRFILGQPILEDWTWSGAPAIVGTYNDALLALYTADGGIPAQTQAAILIDYRILCHAPINDDWTWDGMPAIVNTYNEVLRAANIAAGSPEPTVWLQQYATANGGTQPVQTQAAGIIKARLESGLAINTDWTWPDPPRDRHDLLQADPVPVPGRLQRPADRDHLAGQLRLQPRRRQPARPDHLAGDLHRRPRRLRHDQLARLRRDDPGPGRSDHLERLRPGPLLHQRRPGGGELQLRVHVQAGRLAGLRAALRRARPAQHRHPGAGPGHPAGVRDHAGQERQPDQGQLQGQPRRGLQHRRRLRQRHRRADRLPAGLQQRPQLQAALGLPVRRRAALLRLPAAAHPRPGRGRRRDRAEPLHRPAHDGGAVDAAQPGHPPPGRHLGEDHRPARDAHRGRGHHPAGHRRRGPGGDRHQDPQRRGRRRGAHRRRWHRWRHRRGGPVSPPRRRSPRRRLSG
jgi:hypothetical protein